MVPFLISYHVMSRHVAVPYVTLHEKTKHNARKNFFELRPPLPTTTFELLLLQI